MTITCSENDKTMLVHILTTNTTICPMDYNPDLPCLDDCINCLNSRIQWNLTHDNIIFIECTKIQKGLLTAALEEATERFCPFCNIWTCIRDCHKCITHNIDWTLTD